MDEIMEEKGIYRTIGSEHIAFLLDRMDEYLETEINILINHETAG